MQAFNEVEAFKAAFDEKVASGDKFVVIMTGTINEETGESWCPDCVVAKPHIQRIIDAAAGQRAFIKGIVTRDEWRGNTGHPYR